MSVHWGGRGLGHAGRNAKAAASDPYGPELFVNGTFSNGTTGIDSSPGATVAVVGGELEVTVAAGWYVFQDVPTQIGATYRLTGTLRAAAGNATAQSARIVAASTTVSEVVASNGVTKTVNTTFTATANPTQFTFGVASSGAVGSVGEKAYFDNISIKKVL